MYFPGVPGHMCLQHATTQQGRRFTVGFKHWAVCSLEIMAFVPGPLFHLSNDALFVRLDLAGQTKGAEYLRSSGSPCALYLIDGVWHARWQSSFQHVMPGFSTFLNNSVESSWRVADLVNGDSKRDVTNNMFTNVQRACVVWMHDKKLERIEFMPCGLLSHQPSLLRGDGLFEAKACLYDKQFRRLTVAKIQLAIDADTSLLNVESEVRTRRLGSCRNTIDQERMTNYVSLMFAADVETARQLCPRRDDHEFDFGKTSQIDGRLRHCWEFAWRQVARPPPRRHHLWHF